MRTKNTLSAGRRMRPTLVAFVVLILFGAHTTGFAESLRLRSPDGKSLNAEYLRGDARRPAIVVLHGFLQTHEFLATQSIINSLSALGYTVIGPNLSLGVPDRRPPESAYALN